MRFLAGLCLDCRCQSSCSPGSRSTADWTRSSEVLRPPHEQGIYFFTPGAPTDAGDAGDPSQDLFLVIPKSGDFPSASPGVLTPRQGRMSASAQSLARRHSTTRSASSKLLAKLRFDGASSERLMVGSFLRLVLFPHDVLIHDCHVQQAREKSKRAQSNLEASRRPACTDCCHENARSEKPKPATKDDS